ncbi:MAG: protein-disulfide reductase DsbD domain-containing protein [Micropepsaceae bacterium]
MRISIALCLLSVAAALPAAAGDVATTSHVEARLVSEVEGVPASGGVVSLALLQTMQPEWHTYWRNPGESGEPTTLAWSLPQGFSASDIKWPHPERIPYGELANYGYSQQVLLRSEITVPPGEAVGSTITFKVDATWLVCKDICVPEQATLDLTLPVVEGTPASNAQLKEAFAKARATEPILGGPFDGHFSVRADTVTLYFVPTGKTAQSIGAQFFPYTKGQIKASALQTPERLGQGFAISVPAGWRLRDASQLNQTSRIDGVLVIPSDSGTQAFEISLQKGGVPAGPVAAAGADIPFLQAIAFAILGGLILNLMPCVFPILSMKALSLVRSGHAERPWVDGLVYLAGVMTTFASLAGALLWLRSLGEDVGWGFQLQSPVSVAALAYILAGVGFSLSGLFYLGGSLQNAGQNLSNHTGLVGTFFTGVLAVVVAAPCTAPFMGAAMSFAFTQSAPVTIAVFLALGFGLALPWVIFSMVPALVRLLPRPGEWMDSFKQFLAFPMYGAAAWLVWVISQQVSPEDLFRVMIGLVLLGFSAWAFGTLQRRAAESRSFILSFLFFIAGLGGAIALIAMPFDPARPAQSTDDSPGNHAFAEAYSAARLAKLLAEGNPVFVNLTAAWCVSCLYNERVALSTDAVRNAFRDTGTVYLLGDWTNQNPEISALLKQHGRDGVPLYLYFAADSAAPVILPQILTEGLILDTLKGTK